MQPSPASADSSLSPLSPPVAVPSAGLGSRWVLAAAAAGLVGAGALAGGLLAQRTAAQASTPPQALVEPEATRAAHPGQRRADRADRADALPAKVAAADAPTCPSCGVVESVVAERREGQASGVGAVAGGVVGGLLGNQMGKGNGRKAMTVLGAVGGGLAGNELEKQHKAHTVYVTRVRLQDGSLRTFVRNSPLAVGQAVTVQGRELQVASAAS